MELGTRARRAALSCGVAMGCWMAMAVAGSTAQPAFAHPQPGGVLLPPELVEAVQRDLGIDAREYLQRAETARRLAEFARTARNAHPIAFAGIRMDGSRPIVSLTDGVSAVHARRAAESAGFTVETVADSEATLHARRIAFERWLTGQPDDVAAGVLGYGIDVVHNSFAVRLAKDAQLPSVDGGGRTLPIRSVSAVMPEAGPDDAPTGVRAIADAELAEDYIGGLPYAIELAGKKHKCSFGFNGTDAEGHTVNITAGHCDPNNLVESAAKTLEPQRIFEVDDAMDAAEIGHFEVSVFAPHDYAILRINDAVAPRFQNNLVSTERVAPAPAPQPGTGSSGARPPVGSSGATPPVGGSAGQPIGGHIPDTKRDDVRIDGTTEPIVGANVCKSGFKSGYSCGMVIAVGQKGFLRGVPGHDDQVVEVEDMFYANVCAQRGDSGGPIIAGTKAVGINSAIVTVATPLDNGCGHLPLLLGQPISTVLKENPGVTIRTN